MMYEVEAKFGHVGRNQYVIKTVPVVACSGVEAAEKVRDMPRVKHHHTDAIRQVKEIDAPKYWELVEVHAADPYFRCQSIQEQRVLCPDLEIHLECREQSYSTRKKDVSRRDVYVGKQKIRNPKKYINNFYDCEEYAA